MENLTNLGGFKITNLKTFDYSLKILWVKRIIAQKEGWAEFPIEMGIRKAVRYGDQYLKKLQEEIHNKVWIYMLKGLRQLFSTFKIKNAVQLHWMPPWYKSRQEF